MVSAEGTSGAAPRVLVVEDRESLLKVWDRALTSRGYHVTPAKTLQAALGALSRSEFDLVLTDLRLPDGEGTAVIEAARVQSARCPVIMMTAFGSVQHAVEAMKLGATDFLEKPVDVEDLCGRIDAWLRPQDETRSAALELGDGLSIVGSHPRLLAALRLVERVAPTESTVLLLGESGTGKELFARALHLGSERSRGPFVAVNCAALPEALIENELFGHEKGAFTGASSRQVGRFEAAAGGTLLLDEIGELPLGVQAKILRVLEEKTFDRVGGRGALCADVRLVAATNRDLSQMVSEGTFRSDLYYRLEVFPIELPSLRQRQTDIPALARTLLERAAQKNGMPTPSITTEAARLLSEQEWPGNVRQLSNLLERALILHPDRVLGATEITALMGSSSGSPNSQDDEQVVRRALERSGGDKTEAALDLEVSVRTLQRKIKKYGLEGFPRYTD